MIIIKKNQNSSIKIHAITQLRSEHNTDNKIQHFKKYFFQKIRSNKKNNSKNYLINSNQFV
jgi:hypothetical protein